MVCPPVTDRIPQGEALSDHSLPPLPVGPRRSSRRFQKELPVFLGMEMREGSPTFPGSLETHPRQFVGYRRNPKTGGHFMAIVGYRRKGHRGQLVGYGLSRPGCVLIPWDVLVEDQYDDVWVVTDWKCGNPAACPGKCPVPGRVPGGTEGKTSTRPSRSRNRKSTGSRSALSRRPEQSVLHVLGQGALLNGGTGCGFIHAQPLASGIFKAAFCLSVLESVPAQLQAVAGSWGRGIGEWGDGVLAALALPGFRSASLRSPPDPPLPTC